MGFMRPALPDVDVATWQHEPRAEKLKTLTRHWVEHGFGSPRPSTSSTSSSA